MTQNKPSETGSTEEKLDLPEHDKLKLVQHLTQNINDFLEFLQGEEDGIFLARYLAGSDDAVPVYNKDELIAKFFEIDLKKLEEEKQQILDYIRRQNGS